MLTIAVLIYNAVLYVYMLSILVQWELPKGMVATMVGIITNKNNTNPPTSSPNLYFISETIIS